MKVDNILDNRIQRPESMIIPIGGVWRPDDEPVEQFFLDQPVVTTVSSNSNLTSTQWCVLTSFCLFIIEDQNSYAKSKWYLV